MRISETFFKELLKETDAIKVVSTISNFWSARSSIDKPQFGLTFPEYNVQLCLIYEGEVGNGGHLQFFLNRGTTFLNDTLRALENVQLTEMAENLRKAARPLLDKTANAHIQDTDIDHNMLSLWKILDELVWRTDVDEILLEYMRENSSEILRNERF